MENCDFVLTPCMARGASPLDHMTWFWEYIGLIVQTMLRKAVNKYNYVYHGILEFEWLWNSVAMVIIGSKIALILSIV